jgi:molybdate transport repressor ModE-like protein
MLEVKRLRILKEVAEQGSFSAAADAMHMTQSAVSQQVAALERETGTVLLDRNRGNVRLTDPGEALISHADAVIARLDEAERELADIAGMRGGRLRMVSFPTAGATLVVRAVARFGKTHPEVELALTEAEPEVSIPQLRAGDHDLALIYDYERVPLPELRDTERHFLLEERMQLALPKDHRLADRKRVRMEELVDDTWIVGTSELRATDEAVVRTSAGFCRENSIEACRDAGFEPKIGFESDDYQVHQALISAGMGVSLVPELLLTGRNPGLSVVDIEEPPVRRVWALTRPAGTRGPATEAMLELLRGEAARLAG